MKKTVSCLLIIFSVSVFLFACGNKSDKKNSGADTAANGKTGIPVTEKGVKLVCKEMGVDSIEIPHYDVFLSVDGVLTKIKSVNGCGDITKESYEQYEIPKEARLACGGWWAGAGDYYYVIMRDGKPVVFEGWQDEGQDDEGYHWTEIVVK